jgi:DNA-binding transcriptional ArsR family regulator
MSVVIENYWVTVLKALGHPTRLQIVIELLKGTKCVNDIHELLPASQANISQHLTVLRNARIVDFAQDGSQRCYYVCRPELVAGLLQLLRNEPAESKLADIQCCLHRP